MDRDRRLTGTLRGQSDNPQAPFGFEFTNGWKVLSLPTYNPFFYGRVLIQYAAGEAIYLEDYDVQSELLEEGDLDLEIQMKQSVYIPGRNSASLASIIYMAALVDVGQKSISINKSYPSIEISGLFLLRPSSKVQAWHIAWLDM